MGYLLFTTIMIHLKLGWLGDCFFPLGHLFWLNHDYGKKTKPTKLIESFLKSTWLGRRLNPTKLGENFYNQQYLTQCCYAIPSCYTIDVEPQCLAFVITGMIFSKGLNVISKTWASQVGSRPQMHFMCVFLHVRHGKQIFPSLFQDFPSLQKKKRFHHWCFGNSGFRQEKGWFLWEIPYPTWWTAGFLQWSNVLHDISWFWFIDQGPGNY